MWLHSCSVEEEQPALCHTCTLSGADWRVVGIFHCQRPAARCTESRWIQVCLMREIGMCWGFVVKKENKPGKRSLFHLLVNSLIFLLFWAQMKEIRSVLILLETRFGTVRGSMTGRARHSLNLSFSFELCFCVKCSVYSAQFMSGSHNTMAWKDPSPRRAVTFTFSLWPTCRQTWPICFPFAAFCFLLDSFLSLLSWQSSHIHRNPFILFIRSAPHKRSKPSTDWSRIVRTEIWLAEIKENKRLPDSDGGIIQINFFSKNAIPHCKHPSPALKIWLQ